VLEIPVIRWGKSYESLQQDPVVHFESGETLCKVHQANGGLIQMDLRKQQRARDVLREIPMTTLVDWCKKAADLYLTATLPLGNGTQSPQEFCTVQSATTGLPEHMCASNMKKNHFVLSHMGDILEALTRGLPYDVLTRGFGVEHRGVTVSYQANAPVKLPRRSHALAARDAHASGPGPQTGPARAVDPVPHVRGLRSGRLPPRSLLDLPRRRRSRRRGPARLRAGDDLRRHGHREAISR
jgi:hypothetical protein